MSKGFLDKAYSASDAAGVRSLYDDWAESYDAELTDNAYATPRRCAETLAAHLGDKSLPVLDFGCGTGLSGQALAAAGFETIDGIDLSAEMLAKARAKQVYRDLRQIDGGAPLGHSPGDYSATVAAGVIGVGAAPVTVIDPIMEGLAAGGLFVLSLNDHALDLPEYEGALDSWIGSGRARLLFKEYGPHIPRIGLKANVYVIEKS